MDNREIKIGAEEAVIVETISHVVIHRRRAADVVFLFSCATDGALLYDRRS